MKVTVLEPDEHVTVTAGLDPKFWTATPETPSRRKYVGLTELPIPQNRAVTSECPKEVRFLLYLALRKAILQELVVHGELGASRNTLFLSPSLLLSFSLCIHMFICDMKCTFLVGYSCIIRMLTT